MRHILCPVSPGACSTVKCEADRRQGSFLPFVFFSILEIKKFQFRGQLTCPVLPSENVPTVLIFFLIQFKIFSTLRIFKYSGRKQAYIYHFNQFSSSQKTFPIFIVRDFPFMKLDNCILVFLLIYCSKFTFSCLSHLLISLGDIPNSYTPGPSLLGGRRIQVNRIF